MTTETHSPTGSLSNEEYVARLNRCLDAGVQIAHKNIWSNEWFDWKTLEGSTPVVEFDLVDIEFLVLLPGTSFDEWKANGFPIDDCIPEWLGS